MNLKVFYHPELMPTDKAKILLAGNYQVENGIRNYDTHYASIATRIFLYLKKAIEDGEDIFDLVENYLNIHLEGGKVFDMACQILASPQMQSILKSTWETWQRLENKPMPVLQKEQTLVDVPTGTLGLVDLDGQQRTEELIDEMTLRGFLEQLSMVDED